MWNLKYDTNEPIWNRNRLTKTENLWLPRGMMYRRAMNWNFGISRCKLLYIEWKSNKVLLYSTGNSSQYPVINSNGKEHEKCIFVYN